MIRRVAAAALVATLAVVAAASVATAQPPALEIRDVDASQPGSLAVTVALPPSLAVRDLTDGSFTVRVGGDEVPVTEARRVSTPVDVLLVIDTSGSMEGAAMDAAKAAASQFVDRLAPNIRVAVVGFNASPIVAAPLDEGRNVASAAIAELGAGGETALWDGLVTAASLVEDRPAYVVVLSDGADTASTTTAEQAVTALTDRGAPLYALSLNTSDADREALAEVVDRVGGMLLSADDPDALAPLYDEVASRLSNLWQLSFTPQHSGPQPLVISVADGDVAAVTAEGTAAPMVEPAVDPAILAAPPQIRTVVPNTFASGAALWVGAGAIGAALLMLLLILGWRGVPTLRLSSPRGSADRSLSGRVVGVADRAISEAHRSGLDRALEAADVNVRSAELAVTVVLGAFTLAVVGVALVGPFGAALAVAAPVAARVELGRRASARQRRFADQLPDTLAMLAASLRAGRAVPQAMELLANESPEPTAAEFRRVLIETRIGRDLVDALHRVAERTNSTDFGWAARAIGINRELGGDLAEVLDNVAETIRDRCQIARQVRSLSAEGRLSAWILLGLPLAVAGFVSKGNPGYLDVLFTERMGQAMVGTGLVMFLIGGLWIRRTVALKY